MLINNKQDLFYSLSLTPNSQEYFNLPIPAEASGFRIVVQDIKVDGTSIPVTDAKWGVQLSNTESSGWEQMFEQIRIEDSARTTNDVVLDFRGAEDFGYFTEALLLASPLPSEEYAIRSKAHLDVYTGVMQNPRLFVKTASTLNGVVDSNFTSGGANVTSITIGFMANIGPALPPQSLRVYHIGEAGDSNIEYVYPSGNSPRSVIFTETARNIADVYSNGQHLTSMPESMITDYNVLRNIENNASFDQDMADKAYLNIGSLAGQRIRYEQIQAGKMHVVAIYTEA